MQVLTLIDSLIAAGAERMAVNIANLLADEGIGSHLCATRVGGPLEEFIGDEVLFFVANKKGVLDISALNRIGRYIKNNHINIIHAHSSSIYWGFILKLLFPEVKLVWHDHFGLSEQIYKRPSFWLKRVSSIVDHAFVVNEKLYDFATAILKMPLNKVSFLANFASLDISYHNQVELPDNNCYPKLLCLANLRRQKDHDNLLYAFAEVAKAYPNARLYLVGGHFGDEYYRHLNKRIEKEESLRKRVFILGSRNDVAGILAGCDIGILSSLSEGLPVALLEYGSALLPVVCTDVGDCGFVLDKGRCGELVPAHNSKALADAIIYVLENGGQAQKKAALLKERIDLNFSRKGAGEKILKVYNSLCLDI